MSKTSTIRLFFSALVLILVGLIYNHTNSLVVTHHKKSFRDVKLNLKIAHISDLHSSSVGVLEKQLFKELGEEKPDLIFITGDLATPGHNREGFKQILKKLTAPHGVYLVKGNWEYWEPIERLEELLRENSIHLLNNDAKEILPNLWVVGFDDSEEGSPNLGILNDIPEKDFKIGLFHSPIFFNQVAGKIHLSFAGHSHGGQIKIPFLKPILPEGVGKYIEGWFKKSNSELYVSRGIGTSVLPIRLFCSPELAIINIK